MVEVYNSRRTAQRAAYRHNIGEKYLPIMTDLPIITRRGLRGIGFIVRPVHTLDEAIEEAHRQSLELDDFRFVVRIPRDINDPTRCYTVMRIGEIASNFPHAQKKFIQGNQGNILTLERMIYVSFPPANIEGTSLPSQNKATGA